MMKRKWILGLGGCAAMLAGACAVDPSNDIKTSGLYITYTVTEQSGYVQAVAQFRNGTLGNDLMLTNGDTIRVNNSLLPYWGITHEYRNDVALASTYEFDFQRTGEPMYVSKTSLPAVITITAPAAGTVIRPLETVNITWTNNAQAGTYMNLRIYGNSLNEVSMKVPDSGSYAISGSLLQYSDTYVGKRQIVVELTRIVPGEMDAALKGTITGKAVGTIILTFDNSILADEPTPTPTPAS